MENSSTSSLKKFNCPLHPNELVQRVSSDPQSNHMLFCIECFIDCDKSIRNSLYDMKNLTDILTGHFNKFKSVKIKSSPPESLYQFLEKKEEFLSIMYQHIEKQKESVCAEFKEIQDEILEKLEKAKEKVLIDLEKQLATFKKNFDDYETKINLTFETDSSITQENPYSKENIESEINQCRSEADFESKLKSWLNIIQEKTGDIPEDELTLLHNINLQKNFLMKSLDKLPISFVTDPSLSKSSKDTLMKNIGEYLKNTELVSNKITLFRPPYMNSSILGIDQFKLVFSKISSSQVKTELLYSNKMIMSNPELAKIEKIWLKYPHVLIVIKGISETFACYREANFKKNQQNNYGGFGGGGGFGGAGGGFGGFGNQNTKESNKTKSLAFRFEDKSVSENIMQMFYNGGGTYVGLCASFSLLFYHGNSFAEVSFIKGGGVGGGLFGGGGTGGNNTENMVNIRQAITEIEILRLDFPEKTHLEVTDDNQLFPEVMFGSFK